MSEDRTRVGGSSGGISAAGDSTRVASVSPAPVPPLSGGDHDAFGVARRTSPPPVQVGEVLGHTYRIEAFLAKGGMGAVYRARHVVLESEHAIKIILSELSDDPQVIALLNQEAKTLRTVKNDAVVEYQGLMLDEHGRRYLVMEFVDGPSLATVLRDRRLTPAEVRTLRDRLALGLAAAHEKGIYHRDISPDNVILPGGRIEDAKIIDFGIAKSTAAGEKTIIGGDFAGKYSYASPEQAGMHGGKVDGRSDIYSLGLVLASAAIGFGGKLDMGNSLSSVFEARQKVPDLSQLPAGLRNEIAAMLQPKPEQRPQTMLEVVGLGAKPTRAAGASAKAAGVRQGTSALVVTVAAVSFAVVVALGAGYFLLFPSKPAPVPVAAEAAQGAGSIAPSPPAPTAASVAPPAVPAPANADTARGSQDVASPPVRPAQEALVTPPRRAVDPASLAAEVRRTTGAFPCAAVEANLVGDQDVRLVGFVSSDSELAKLHTAISNVADIGRIDDSGVAVYALTQCQMIKLVRDTATPELPAPRLEFNNPDLVYRDGDTLVVKASATPAYNGYLYVDYFDNEGNVVHMLPMPLHPDNRMKAGQVMALGAPKEGGKGGKRVYGIEAPFGPNLIVAISSPTPLFKKARTEEQESAENYLSALTQELKSAAAEPGGGHIAATYTLFNTLPR